MLPKVAFFDLNHTVYDLTHVPKGDLKAYSKHLEKFAATGLYHSLEFPERWGMLPAWSDAITAIHNMRAYLKIQCVTLSNNPINLQIQQARHNKIFWDWMVPLEAKKTFKPCITAYEFAVDVLRVEPKDCLMITANRTFGDIEMASNLGMRTVWVDRKNEEPSHPIKTLRDVVDLLHKF